MSVTRIFPLLIATLVLLPVAVIFSSFFAPADDVWRHFAETILGELVVNTLVLALCVATGTAFTGVALAWLVAVCEFPGRRFFSWALLLPLAMPAYVMGFVAIGLLDFTGPLQTTLRSLTNSALPWFPPIRSRGGVILVMTLALYPYVYLLARNAFRTQGKRMLEAGRALGLSAFQSFIRVALPMARPWISAGVLLVVMETLADFGTVSVFNYDTLTTGIYKAWYGLFSLVAASQIASILILLALVTLLIEQRSRLKMRFTTTYTTGQPPRFTLSGWRKWLAAGVCITVLVIAVIIPVSQLAIWVFDTGAIDLDVRYLDYLWHSLALGALAAGLVTFAALLLNYSGRRHADRLSRVALKLSTIGYAVPGAVLAVGIFVALAWVDRLMPAPLREILGFAPGALLQGSVLAMLLAYLVRFLAVGYGPVESALHRVTRNLEEAAIALGQGGMRLLLRVHLPLLRGGLVTAAILVFVDVMKEMPITLMTRPFGWDTLSVRIFELTSEGEWERAALPAVVLVAAGALPVIQLTRASE